MKHPTHAVRAIDNWDGEGDIYTVLAYQKEGQFYSFETDRSLLEHEGDKIIKTWELKL